MKHLQALLGFVALLWLKTVLSIDVGQVELVNVRQDERASRGVLQEGRTNVVGVSRQKDLVRQADHFPPTESSRIPTQDTSYFPIIDRAMNLVHREVHFEAIGLFSRLIAQYPNHPMGYFFRAATLQTLMRDYRTRQFEARFQADLDSAIRIGERLKQQFPQDEWIYFYLGGAYGFRGLQRVRKGDWLGGFRDGWRGVRNLKKAHQINPENFDVLFGLGTYHYWRSARANILRLLPFFGDRRQEGIDELWLAYQKGRFTPIEALYALQAVYYDFGKLEKAMDVNQMIYQKFPTNPVCLYYRGRILEKLGRMKEAREIFQRLLTHLHEMPYTSPGLFMDVHFHLALTADRLGLARESRDHLKQAYLYLRRRDPEAELDGPLENPGEIVDGMNALQRKLLRRKSSASSHMQGKNAVPRPIQTTRPNAKRSGRRRQGAPHLSQPFRWLSKKD